MKSLGIVALVAGACVVIVTLSSPHRAARGEVSAEFDRLWAVAVKNGADADRWPLLSFVDYGDDPLNWAYRPLAQTRCTQPHPVVEVNDRFLRKFEWFAVNIAPPHEMAHVLVCLDGDVEGWAKQHGSSWERWLREIVTPEQAADVLEAQQLQEERDGGDVYELYH